MKFKWYLSIVVAFIAFILGYNSGQIIERTIEYEILESNSKSITSEYNKLTKKTKQKLSRIELDSINNRRFVLIGYRQSVLEIQNRLKTTK